MNKAKSPFPLQRIQEVMLSLFLYTEEITAMSANVPQHLLKCNSANSWSETLSFKSCSKNNTVHPSVLMKSSLAADACIKYTNFNVNITAKTTIIIKFCKFFLKKEILDHR